MVAGIDAVNDSGIDFSRRSVSLRRHLGSGSAGSTRLKRRSTAYPKGPDKVSAFTIPKLMVNAASGHLSIRYGLRGPNYAVATACASAPTPWATPSRRSSTTTPT